LVHISTFRYSHNTENENQPLPTRYLIESLSTAAGNMVKKCLQKSKSFWSNKVMSTGHRLQASSVENLQQYKQMHTFSVQHITDLPPPASNEYVTRQP